MLFIVRFYDKPDSLHVRNAHFDAHVRWLDAHRDTVLVPGALRAAPDGPAVGGLWVARAPDRETLERLLQTDPFWVHGLRERYEIYVWHKAFPEREVPV